MSRCDGTAPIVVSMTDEYPAIAQRVHAFQASELNAIWLTVEGTLESHAGEQDLPRVQHLRVTRIVATGERVECNLSGKNHPLVGTRWIHVASNPGGSSPRPNLDQLALFEGLTLPSSPGGG